MCVHVWDIYKCEEQCEFLTVACLSSARPTSAVLSERQQGREDRTQKLAPSRNERFKPQSTMFQKRSSRQPKVEAHTCTASSARNDGSED